MTPHRWLRKFWYTRPYATRVYRAYCNGVLDYATCLRQINWSWRWS